MEPNPEIAVGGTHRLLELIEAIYAAVQRPDLWPQVLDRIAAAVGAQQTVLFTDTRDPALPAALRGAGTDPVVLEELLEYYGSVNVLSEPCDAMFATGEVRYSHLAMPDAEFERTEFYNDFFKPWDMHYSYGIKISVPGQVPAYLSCQRPRSAEPFGPREGIVLQTLAPHLRRAMSLHRRMAERQTGILGLEAALGAFDHVVFGLNAERRVVLMNGAAEQMMRQGDPLRLIDGRLAAVATAQNEALQRLLTVAIGKGLVLLQPQQGAMSLTGRQPLHLVVSPFPGTLDGLQQLAAIVVVHDPARRPLSRAAVLRSLYRLTATEARIADLLLQGLDARDAAEQIRITLETARFHVKRVLAKTGARKQSELIRLMLSLPGSGVSL